MSSFWKKIAHYMNPVNTIKQIEKNPSSAMFSMSPGAMALTGGSIKPGLTGSDLSNAANNATRAQNQADLDAAMKQYYAIPDQLRAQYTADAQKAGTFGTTPEFEAGLNSEVQAGARGARIGAVDRINALRRSLGNNEAFVPVEGYTATNANTPQLNPGTPSATAGIPQSAAPAPAPIPGSGTAASAEVAPAMNTSIGGTDQNQPLGSQAAPQDSNKRRLAALGRQGTAPTRGITAAQRPRFGGMAQQKPQYTVNV